METFLGGFFLGLFSWLQGDQHIFRDFFCGICSVLDRKESARPINWIKIPQLISSLFIPLMIGAVAIGWYNWVRFDSRLNLDCAIRLLFSTLNKQMGLVFQPDYFLPNLYGYVFQPFEFIARFPFIQPINGSGILNRLMLTPPYLYAAGRVTGLLFCAPFLLLSLVHLFSSHKSTLPDRPKSHSFPIYLLLGSFFNWFSHHLILFLRSMRFLVDIISQITLLAVMGYWKLIYVKKSKDRIPKRQSILLACPIFL